MVASVTRREKKKQLCLTDVALASGVRRGHARHYGVIEHGASGRIEPVRAAEGARVCVSLPARGAASPQAPSYRVIDWVSRSEGFPEELPARVHLYDLGSGRFAVAGLERPDSFAPPELP